MRSTPIPAGRIALLLVPFEPGWLGANQYAGAHAYCQAVPRRAGSPDMKEELGARIREFRETAGVTQEQLAWDCDLDKGYMSQVEAGKRTPSLPVLFAVAERLGVEAADIVALDLGNARLALLDAARRGDVAAIRSALEALGLSETL